jgi:hypothetical protein
VPTECRQPEPSRVVDEKEDELEGVPSTEVETASEEYDSLALVRAAGRAG